MPKIHSKSNESFLFTYLRVVKLFPKLVEGEEVRLVGEWVNHSTYGKQFKASLVEQTLPADAAGAVNIIFNNIEGIRTKGFNNFNSRWFTNTLYDSACKITQNSCISENPYAFVCESGYSFERAEEIAGSLDSPDLYDYRCQAGVVFVVRHNLDNGHTCLPRSAVVKSAMNYLECSEDAAEISIDNAIQGKQLFSDDINGALNRDLLNQSLLPLKQTVLWTPAEFFLP